MGFSRDGFHWDRPDRRPFLAVNPLKDAWNWGNVQSAGGVPGVVAGMMQIVVQVPSGTAAGNVPVLAQVGTASTQSGVTIAVK